MSTVRKRIVRVGRALGNEGMVATQKLESMMERAVPTRVKASDLATTIHDGADAVMLKFESASGKYTAVAVGLMTRVMEAGRR